MVVRFRLSDAIPKTRSAFPFKARWYTPAVGPSCLRALANHASSSMPSTFSQAVVLLGSVADQVRAFYLALRRIALSEIDQTRALGAKEIHPKAQRFRLSIIVHG